MKFTAVVAFITAATAVSAATNAERFARGLGPNAPAKRATRVRRGNGSSPSGTPSTSSCNTGSMSCCNSVGTAGSSSTIDSLLSELGLVASVGTLVGSNCSPITALGVGSGSSCTQQTVCCDNTHFNGLVNIGCSPININL